MSIELIEPDETLEPTPNLPATVEERAGLALASTKTEADLLALVEKAKAITLVNSPDGRDECHSQLMVLVRSRTTITKAAKDARDDATKFNKAVIAEEARLIAITAAEEKRLQTLRDAWDNKVAAEKEARAAAERARVLAITGRIAEIKGYANLAAQCRTSARIQDLIDKLGAVELTGFEEFEQEAKDARAETMKAMEQSFDTKKADEDERARVLAEQQAEAERQRLQAEELARQQAELEAQRAALQAQADAQAAEAKRLQDEREAQAAEAERLAVAAVMLSAVLDEPEPAAPVAEPYAGPWCCPDAKAQGVPVCQSCAESSAAFQAELGVAPRPQEQQASEPLVSETNAPEASANAAPVATESVAAPSNVVTLPLPAANAERPRPSDYELVVTLAVTYRVEAPTIVEWLRDMDLEKCMALLTFISEAPKEKA